MSFTKKSVLTFFNSCGLNKLILLQAFIVSTVMAQPVHAGVKVDLNGASSQEKVAFNLITSIKSILRAAKENKVRFALSEEEVRLLDQIVADEKVSASSLEIQFLELDPPGTIIYDPLYYNKFAISLMDIFDKNLNLLHHDDITLLLVQTWLGHPRLYAKKRELLKELLRKSLNAARVEYRVFASNNSIRLEEAQIKINDRPDSTVLAIKSSLSSLEINSQIESAIPCHSERPVQLIRATNTTVNSRHVSTEIFYQCNDMYYFAELSFKLPKKLSTQTLRNISFNIYNKRGFNFSCVSSLTD